MPPKLHQLQNVIANEGIINTICLGRKTSQVFATGGDDRFLHLWSVGNNNPRSSFGPFQSVITTSKFDGAEERIACGNNGGTIMLFDLNESRCVSNWAAHRSRVNSIAFNPQDEKMVISCGYDGKMKVFTQNQKSPVQTYSAHEFPANCVAISGDGKYVATCSDDKFIKIFDIVAQRQIAKFGGHTESVTKVEFHPTERVLISCSVDRSIRFFNLESMNEIPVSFPLDSSPVDVVTFIPGENIAISGSADYLKIVGWSPPEFFDHFTLGLEHVNDISVVDRIATIASSNKDRCLIHKIRLDQLKPFVTRSYKSRPETPRFLDMNIIKKTPVSVPSSEPVSQPTSSKKSTRLLKSADTANINSKESQVFLEFRKNRSSFMSAMNEKYSRLTRVKDMIQHIGILKTLQTVAQSGDLGIECLMLMRMKPDAVKLEHAALLMQIAVRSFDKDFDLAITTTESMLQAFGRLVNATRQISLTGVGQDTALQDRKRKCELFVESFREIAPKLRTVSVSRSVAGQTAAEILDEWKIFLR